MALLSTIYEAHYDSTKVHKYWQGAGVTFAGLVIAHPNGSQFQVEACSREQIS